MTYPVFSIRDVKTGFMAPTIDLNSEAAARNFLHAVAHSTDVMSSNPADFSLYHVADFDTDSGLFAPVAPPVFIVGASVAFKVGDSNG